MTGIYETECRRQSDIYVFAVLAHVDKLTVNPLDMSQWGFHVVPTEVINATLGTRKTLTLRKLQDLSGMSIPYSRLKEVVEKLECEIL